MLAQLKLIGFCRGDNMVSRYEKNLMAIEASKTKKKKKQEKATTKVETPTEEKPPKKSKLTE